MGIFSKRRKSQKIRDETDVTYTLSQLNDYFSGDNVFKGGNLNAATYFACMQIRCNALAKIPFKCVQVEYFKSII